MAKRTPKIRKGPTQSRRAAIVQAIANIARSDWRNGVTETLLSHEGVMVATLRAGLCRDGLDWAWAHQEATEVVAEGLSKAGAKRPSWREGQPEWTDGGVIRHQRLRCANCEGQLEEGQRIFCGKTCFDAHRGRLRYHDNVIVLNVAERVNFARRGASNV